MAVNLEGTAKLGKLLIARAFLMQQERYPPIYWMGQWANSATEPPSVLPSLNH
jgi:hypothetical protein